MSEEANVQGSEQEKLGSSQKDAFRERIQQAAAQAVGQTDTDARSAKAEEEAYSKDSPELALVAQRALIAESNARTASHEADTWIKTWLAPNVFRFMQAWCSYVAVIFLTYFFMKDGNIPSEIMIALLGTTTVSIVGLVGFLVQGLFKSGENRQQGNGPQG
ncbi:hypothetical protein D3C84_731840 [compost metagenome]